MMTDFSHGERKHEFKCFGRWSHVDTKMINLDDITIVIPTHERNWLIKKSINYYKTLGCVVVVLDSVRIPLSLKP